MRSADSTRLAVKGLSVAERIERPSEKVTESGCWVWMASCQRRLDGSTGYPRIKLRGRGDVYAHRVSYEAFHGLIPDGLEVCHHCDVPLCVNPNHLFLGTHRENFQDASRKGRLARPGFGLGRKVNRPTPTHCPAGHPYAGANLLPRSRGGFGCRTCVRRSQREHAARKRAARRQADAGGAL